MTEEIWTRFQPGTLTPLRVELYPAESRLVDTANQYHLYVVDSKAFRFGFGFQSRAVREAGHDGKWKQRAVAP